MRGNLYAVNTVAEAEEVIEFRHLIESATLTFACYVAVLEEEKRCEDIYGDSVKNVRAVSGELLVNGDEVVVDSALEAFLLKGKDE